MGDLDEHHLVVRMFESVLNALNVRGAVIFGVVRFSDRQLIAFSSDRSLRHPCWVTPLSDGRALVL